MLILPSATTAGYTRLKKGTLMRTMSGAKWPPSARVRFVFELRIS